MRGFSLRYTFIPCVDTACRFNFHPPEGYSFVENKQPMFNAP
jgi:hypothetical protein